MYHVQHITLHFMLLQTYKLWDMESIWTRLSYKKKILIMRNLLNMHFSRVALFSETLKKYNDRNRCQKLIYC